MKVYLRDKRSRTLAVLVGAILICALAINFVRNIRDKNEVRHMTQTMKTVCVGRFLIDVPADAQVSFRPAFLSGWTIWSDKDETDEQFTERLAKTEMELKDAKNQNGWNSLESTSTVSQNGFNGKIFEYGRKWTSWVKDNKKVTIEDVSVDGYIRANDLNFNFTASGTWPGHSKRLAQIIAQVRPLADGEIPTEPGFCIERGIINDPINAGERERITMSVDLKGHPDISIVFSTMAGLKPDPSLLTRDDQNSFRQEHASHFHVFRRGAISINGIPGEEKLERVSEPNGTTGHDFSWESISKQDDVMLPELSLELSTGNGRPNKPIESSLSDDAVLALWDKISLSLRIRPTKDAKPVVAAPVILPLGSYVSAQQPCPVSGWWKCSDGDERIKVENGEYQYFRQGVRMPQAVLLGPPTLWQRITGDRPRFSHKTDTVWTLANRRTVPRAKSATPRVPAAGISPTDGNVPLAVAELSEDSAPMKTPAGTLVATGATCPESGWWTCAEPGALDGPQWFARGEPMPDATIKATPSWFERLRGSPSDYRISSAWRFIRHDEAPLSSPVAGAALDQHAATSTDSTGALANTPKSEPQEPTKET